MPLQIIRNDITKLTCDAIVNAANSSLLGGGGVDGAIHKAAGRGLLLECITLGGCKVGQAKITGGHKLPAKYIIHTVGPKWRGGTQGEKELLESCYRESLKLALENNCESVAFPLISSGIYGYPKDQALKVAIDIISGFLLEHDILVYIVVFDKSAFEISEKLFRDIKTYIDDKYVDAHTTATLRNEWTGESMTLRSAAPMMAPHQIRPSAMEDSTILAETQLFSCKECLSPSSLEDAVNQIDESFSQMLLRKIDEKGMTDAECYKKANIDRKLFSKIRNDIHYKPSKPTAIAFAIALELSIEETTDLLMKAGFALSNSYLFDVIIQFFIENKNYNIFEINQALFKFDQSLLGV